jgi:hypothetical protein
MKSPKKSQSFSFYFLITLYCTLFGLSLPSPNYVASAQAQVPGQMTLAFPGAEGFGRFTSGGRGGQVIKVTNLNDSGPGSLREAIETKTTRIVVFEVSGTIHLQSSLRITHPNITVAGQTAPGDGITLTNYPFEFASSNIIVRFMRFRLGANVTDQYLDAMTSNFNRNIIVDHCSLSWGTDETGSFYANENFTLQWCILSEGLNRSTHSKGEHGYGGIWGGKNASFHHNLMAHFTNRNPRFDSPDVYKTSAAIQEYRGVVDFRNNAIYNWRDEASRGGEAGTFNMVNNYYKPGPASLRRNFFLHPHKKVSNGVLVHNYGKFFISGNVLEGNSTVTNDNWAGVSPTAGSSSDIPGMKLNSALQSNVYEVTHTATEAYEKILQLGGASLIRDAVDNRIIQETRTGTFTFNGSNGSTLGIIDHQRDAGGWPTLRSQPALKDSDGDGMPDAWEIEMGLNPSVTNDREYKLSPYYTDIEVYINSIVEHIVNETNPGVPTKIHLIAPAQNVTVVPVDVNLGWQQNSTTDTYSVQVSTAADFSANVLNFSDIKVLNHVIPSLSANTTYFWRVRGVNENGPGAFSDTFSFKTSSTNIVPQAPNLLSPSNSETGVSVNATLTWSKVPNTANYKVQVATDANFSNLVFDQGNLSNVSLTVPNLQHNTLHYWRVRGTNSTGTGSYSQVQTFRTASFSSLPNLTYLTRPGHNTTIHPVSINFEWEAEPTAESYTVQVSTDPDFTTYVINERGVLATSFAVDNLNSNTTYFWRVRCVNRTGGSSPSSVWKLTTSSFTQKPSKVLLVSPTHDSNRFSTSITFTWRLEPTAKHYRLQVSTSSDFSSNVTTQEQILGTTHTVTGLRSNTTYFWRVIAINEVGTGPLSETRKVISSSYSGIPAATKLISPADKSNAPANKIRVTWENVTSANEYRLQVSESFSFSTYVVNVGLLDGTSFQLPQLKENTTYYWRVRTKNPSGDGDRSAIWSFTTTSNQKTPEQSSLVSPTNGENGLSSTVKVSWDSTTLAESYELEVSEQNTFNTLSHTIKNQRNIYHILTGLKSGTTYFWRVRGIRNGVAGPYSTTWSFATAGTMEILTVSSSKSSTSLLGHWKFEEKSGSKLVDHSGRGNDANINQTSGITWIPGKKGLGIKLDAAVNVFGSVPHKSNLNLIDKITIAAWIRPMGFANKQILSKGSTNGYELSITQEGFVEFRFNREANGSTYRLRSVKKYPTDGKTWIHVAATFDGTQSKIYINGVLDASATYSPAKIIGNTGEIQLGARKGNNRWLGGLDEILLYNKALTASEIKNLTSDILARTMEASKEQEDETMEVKENTPEQKPTFEGRDVLDAKLYPNPAQKTIHIKFPQLMDTAAQLTITDLAGKEIVQTVINGSSDLISYDLPLHMMTDGIYLVHIKCDLYYKVFRLIKN